MMVMALHDRISGHANRVRVLDRFFTYVKTKRGRVVRSEGRDRRLGDEDPRQDPLSRSWSGSEDWPFGSVRLT